MIDLRARLYEKLAADPTIAGLVNGNIHSLSDDSDRREFDDRLPEIVFSRIAGRSDAHGVREETYQVSAWAASMGGETGAEAVSRAVISLLNRSTDQAYKYARLAHIADAYDRESKACGVHMTFVFTMLDTLF